MTVLQSCWKPCRSWQPPQPPQLTDVPPSPLLPTPPAEVYGFSSERKMASVLVKRPGALRLYNKGAAEMVLTRCVAMVDANGGYVPMTEVGGQDWECWWCRAS